MNKLYFFLLITGVMYSQGSIQVQRTPLFGDPNFGRTYWHIAPVSISRTVTPKSSITYDYHTRSFKRPSIELEIDSIVRQTIKQLNYESKISNILPVSLTPNEKIYSSMLRQSYSR